MSLYHWLTATATGSALDSVHTGHWRTGHPGLSSSQLVLLPDTAETLATLNYQLNHASNLGEILVFVQFT